MVNPRPLRCAIYTRKSTEEGLDQNFNSIDAQREACFAYITSQKSEGWTAPKSSYDDGGFSGGNMDRPALQQLMKDIAANKIDIIVVYKIDRLTRSLWDFVKLAGLFDKHSVTFVSVTQSFNTTTSMGRLTMNILLSFAQFEREITGERIRDKFTASKKKGIWMGGTTPTGYDVRDRQLVPNEQAAFVRELFELYLKLGDIVSVTRYFKERSIKSVIRTRTNGTQVGGSFISTGMVRHMLMNPVYIGKIRHKKEVYPGLHPAIIPVDLWEKVQEKIAERSNATRRQREFAGNPRLLAGKLFDAFGARYNSITTHRHRKKYKYYTLSMSARKNAGSTPYHFPGPEIEGHVYNTLQAQLKDPKAVGNLLKLGPAGNAEVLQFIADNREKLIHLNKTVDKVTIETQHYTLELQIPKLCRYIDEALGTGIAGATEGTALKLAAPFQPHNVEIKTTATAPPGKEGDIELLFDMREKDIKKLVYGVAWREEHFKGKKSLGRIAEQYGVSRGLVEKLIMESFDKTLRPYFSFYEPENTGLATPSINHNISAP